MRKAGAAGSKEFNRLMTDLKIPESARKQILFFEKDGEVLWLPGFGHGTGFTDALSRERYSEGRPEGDMPENMVMFTIERQ
jgi:tRNA(Ile)-lysidine synthase